MKTKFGIVALEGMEEEVQEYNPVFIPHANNEIVDGESDLLHQITASYEVDEIVDTLSALEEISATLSNSNPEDMTESAATVLNTAIEHFCNRCGLPSRRIIATEGFSSKVTRKQSMSLAIESVGGVIKAMVLKIIEWIKSAAKWIYNIIRNFGGGAEKLGKRAKKIQDSVNSITSKKIKDGVHGIDDIKLARYFSSNTKLIDPNSISKLYIDLNNTLNASFKDEFLKEILNSLNTVVELAATGKTETEVLKEINDLLNKYHNTIFKDFTTKADKFVGMYTLPFDQKVIHVNYLQKGGSTYSMKIAISTDKSNQPVKNKSILGILTPSQITEISKAVEDEMVNGLYKDHEKTIKEIETIEKVINQGCDNIIRRQKAQENESDKGLTYSVQFIKDLGASMVSLMGIIHHYDVVASKNCLDYCEQSIKQYV